MHKGLSAFSHYWRTYRVNGICHRGFWIGIRIFRQPLPRGHAPPRHVSRSNVLDFPKFCRVGGRQSRRCAPSGK